MVTYVKGRQASQLREPLQTIQGDVAANLQNRQDRHACNALYSCIINIGDLKLCQL